MAKKRAVGEGTIYRRQDGRYEVALRSLTTAGTYKRIRKYAQTRAEADELLTELKRQVQQGVPVPDRTWRLDAYLDYWLREVVLPNRRPATYERDEQAIRLYLAPGLGSVPLTRLTVPRLQQFLNQQSAAGQSASTVRQIAKVLSAALTRAMKEELVTRNVAQLIDLPAYSSQEVRPWTFAEAIEFLRVAENDALYPAFVLSLLYGLRRGEVLGLRWCDVDFDAGILYIRQQLQRRHSGLIIGEVKTKASARDLSLRPMARGVLLAQRDTQARAREKACEWPAAGETGELVFTTSTGHPVEPRNFVRSFHRICEQHGLRRIRVHDLRHTAATLLDELAVSPKDVQFTLGHSRASMTIGRYQHGSLASSDRALARIESVLSGSGIDLAKDQDPPSSLSCRQSAKSSRQIVPSDPRSGVSFMAATSGAEVGIRTRDPRLTIQPWTSFELRLTEVNRVLCERRRRCLIGFVAVKASRQNPQTPSHAQVCRSTITSASVIHASRCATSLRVPRTRGSE